MPGPWDKYAAQPTDVQKNSGAPWEKYSAPAATAAEAATPAAPGPLDRLAQWGEKTFPNISKKDASTSESDALNPQRGTAPELARIVTNTGNSMLRSAASIPAAAAEWVGEGLKGLSPSKLLHPIDTISERLAEHASQPGTVLQPGQTPPDPTEENYADYGSQAAGNLGLGLLAGEAVGGLMKLPGAAKRMISGDVMAPIPGEGVSPLERYNTAKRNGVQLNAADATNAPIPKIARAINEHSLVGSPVYDAARARNVGAVTTMKDQLLNAMSPVSREEGGKVIQSNLENNRMGLESGANDRYEDLSSAMGNRPMEGSESVGATARKILDDEEPFNKQYPHLEPKQAMGIVRDVASRFAPPKPVKTSFLDAPDSEFAVPSAAPPTPKGLTYPEAQNIRSRTMDVTRRTNDLTADRGIGMLKQIVGSTDDAITNSAGGLSPDLAEIYRDANDRYREMKEKYDDPSSPLYHAIRTDNPSSLTSGIGQQTPENIRDLIPRIGPEGTGALQRGVAEKAMGVDKNGLHNVSGFGKRFQRIPVDYRNELYSPQPLFAGRTPPMSDDFRGPLSDLGSISNVMEKDLNPSGTAKQGQKLAEAMGMIPTGGLPLLQYPLARVMNSPKAVDWLMRPSTLPNSFYGPAAGAAAAAAPKRKHVEK